MCLLPNAFLWRKTENIKSCLVNYHNLVHPEEAKHQSEDWWQTINAADCVSLKSFSCFTDITESVIPVKAILIGTMLCTRFQMLIIWLCGKLQYLAKQKLKKKKLLSPKHCFYRKVLHKTSKLKGTCKASSYTILLSYY